MSKSFKSLVLGKAGKTKVKSTLRVRKGKWDEMVEPKKKKKQGNFWVDTSSWF